MLRAGKYGLFDSPEFIVPYELALIILDFIPKNNMKFFLFFVRSAADQIPSALRACGAFVTVRLHFIWLTYSLSNWFVLIRLGQKNKTVPKHGFLFLAAPTRFELVFSP